MITYGCPQCRGTINSPESEIGKILQCPHCQSQVQVPVGNKSNTALIVGLISAVMVAVVGCPLAVFISWICLAAISVLGTRASGTFTSVGHTISGS